MDGIKEFRKFTRFLFQEHDISRTNLNISKPNKTILMLIDEHQDKPMSQISREIGLEKSSFTRAVDQFVKAGLIKKEQSAEDRRVTKIIFTGNGDQAVKLIKEDWEQYFSSLTAVLNDKEKQEFARAVEVVSFYMNIIMNKNNKL